MSQSAATKLIPKLRFKVHDRRRLKNPEGPLGRHDKIKKIVTALYKYERIELNYNKADESRGYAERLISEAIKYGDTHQPTMEMASYWIVDKAIIHKLFKVLAPRYKDFKTSYTKLWRAPKVYPGMNLSKCVLELRGNIYPPLVPDQSNKKNLIHNILLEEARKVFSLQNPSKEEEKTIGTEASENNPVNNENIQVNVAGSETGTQEELLVEENSQVKVTVENDCKSNVSETNTEKEVLVKENVEAKSGSENEIKENSEENFAVKEDLDLSKMKISEKEQTESSTEEEKK